MSKLINRPIVVIVRAYSIVQVRIGKKLLRVNDVLEHWREAGRWWEGESEKDFHVVAGDKGQYIIYKDTVSKRWFLYKVLD